MTLYKVAKNVNGISICHCHKHLLSRTKFHNATITFYSEKTCRMNLSKRTAGISGKQEVQTSRNYPHPRHNFCLSVSDVIKRRKKRKKKKEKKKKKRRRTKEEKKEDQIWLIKATETGVKACSSKGFIIGQRLKEHIRIISQGSYRNWDIKVRSSVGYYSLPGQLPKLGHKSAKFNGIL